MKNLFKLMGNNKSFRLVRHSEKEANVDEKKSKHNSNTSNRHIYFSAGAIAFALIILAVSIFYNANVAQSKKSLSLESYQDPKMLLTSPSPNIGKKVVTQNPTQQPKSTTTPKTDYSYHISILKSSLNAANDYINNGSSKTRADGEKTYQECIESWNKLEAESNTDYSSYKAKCEDNKYFLNLKVDAYISENKIRKADLEYLISKFEAGNPSQADFDLYNKYK